MPSLSERLLSFPSLGIDASLFSLVSPGSLGYLKEQLLRRISSFSLGASHDEESVQENVDAEDDDREETVNRLSGRREVQGNRAHSCDAEEKKEKEQLKEEKEKKKKEEEKIIVDALEVGKGKERNESLKGREEDRRRTKREEEEKKRPTSSSSSPSVQRRDRFSQQDKGHPASLSRQKRRSSLQSHDEDTSPSSSPPSPKARELPVNFSETAKEHFEFRQSNQRHLHQPPRDDFESHADRKKKISRRVDFFTLWNRSIFPPIHQLHRRLRRALFVDSVFSRLNYEDLLTSPYRRSHLATEGGEDQDKISSSSSSSSSSSHSQEEGRRRKERRPRHLLQSSSLDTSEPLLSSSSSLQESPSSLSPSPFPPQHHQNSRLLLLNRLRKEEEDDGKIFDRAVYDRVAVDAISSPDGGEKDLLRALDELTRGGETGGEWYALLI